MMSINLAIFFALLGLVMSAPTLLSDQEEWANFKEGFNKSYLSPEEESHRFQIFQDNLNRIKEHNEKFARGESTYTQGINEFTDLTHEEFKARFTGYRRRPANSNKQ